MRLIQKAKYDVARELWRVVCPHFWAERGEQLRELGQLTSADQLQVDAFLHDHPFM